MTCLSLQGGHEHANSSVQQWWVWVRPSQNKKVKETVWLWKRHYHLSSVTSRSEVITLSIVCPFLCLYLICSWMDTGLPEAGADTEKRHRNEHNYESGVFLLLFDHNIWCHGLVWFIDLYVELKFSKCKCCSGRVCQTLACMRSQW